LRFNAAYCQNPICTPSRVSILTGQYCHNHGYYGLGGPTPPRPPTNLLGHLRAQGYRTAAFGKLHLPNAPCNLIAADVDVFGEAYESPDGDLDHSDFLRGLTARGLRHLEDSWHNDSGHYQPGRLSWDARPSDLPYEDTMERWAASQAMAFMAAADDRPFCVQVCFQRPHHPLLPQRQFWDLYPADLPLPSTYDQDPSHRPPHFQEMWRYSRSIHWDHAQPGDDERAGPRRAWRGTLACISQMDDIVGRLVVHLRERGLEQDTIVIYLSDHGAYHGVHGLVEKAPGICADAVCRIPFIWRVPGLTPAGTLSEALVEAIDLAPTVATLCGVPPMDSADGEDLSALLGGAAGPGKAGVLTENPWSKALRWDRWRYVRHPPALFNGADHDELYTLESDPLETRNLARDPAHRDLLLEARGRLIDHLAATQRVVTNHQAVRLSGDDYSGRSTFPLAPDGRAPASMQPRRRGDNLVNYL
jgi:arylsulfatase A-like enzyme